MRSDRALLALALVLPTIVTWLYFVALADQPAAAKAAYAIGKGVQFALPLVAVFLLQRQRLALPRPHRDGLILGLGFGLAVGAMMLGLYYFVLGPRGFFAATADEVRAKIAAFGVTSPATYAIMGLFYSLVHSLLEEYYWRWYVFGQLRRDLPLWPAIAISAVAFTAHHVVVLALYFGWTSPATWTFSLGVAVGGAAWAWLYDRTQSLYGPWLSHLVVDAAIFWIGFDLVRTSL